MKTYHVEGIGDVHISKRRNAKRITLRIKDNQPHISIPRYSSYSSGLTFAQSRTDWIKAHTNDERVAHIEAGTLLIDKEIDFEYEDRKTIRLVENENSFIFKLPSGTNTDDTDVQERLKTKLRTALRTRAEARFPALVDSLAELHGFTYTDLTIAELKSRWGSCDSKKRIKLSLYLAQLPHELIEYVILHELTHTEHLNHSADFKARLEEVLPGYCSLQKELKTYSNELILL